MDQPWIEVRPLPKPHDGRATDCCCLYCLQLCGSLGSLWLDAFYLVFQSDKGEREDLASNNQQHQNIKQGSSLDFHHDHPSVYLYPDCSGCCLHCLQLCGSLGGSRLDVFYLVGGAAALAAVPFLFVASPTRPQRQDLGGGRVEGQFVLTYRAKVRTGPFLSAPHQSKHKVSLCTRLVCAHVLCQAEGPFLPCTTPEQA